MTYEWQIDKATGELRIKQKSEFDQWVQSVARTDKDVFGTCEWKVRMARRSLSQNAFYHAVCVPMVCARLRELGHDVTLELTHEFLKNRFVFTELVDKATGEYIKIPRSTASLSKSEFMDFIAEIQRFAAETLQITIPNPGEQLEIDQ